MTEKSSEKQLKVIISCAFTILTECVGGRLPARLLHQSSEFIFVECRVLRRYNVREFQSVTELLKITQCVKFRALKAPVAAQPADGAVQPARLEVSGCAASVAAGAGGKRMHREFQELLSRHVSG